MRLKLSLGTRFCALKILLLLLFYLFVLQAWVEEELLIYEAFPFQASDSSAADQRLKLRFKKFDHGLILKERARSRQRRKGDEEEEEDLSHLDKILRLRCFNDVSGYSGVKK